MTRPNGTENPKPLATKLERMARIVVLILQNPAAITGIGAVILASGLLISWSHAPIFTLMLVAGTFGTGFALDDLKKKKRNRNRMRTKHIAALIAVAGIFLVTGLVTLMQSAPIPTIMTLIGAAIAAVGARGFLDSRRGPRMKSGMTRSIAL